MAPAPFLEHLPEARMGALVAAACSSGDTAAQDLALVTATALRQWADHAHGGLQALEQV